MQNTNILLERKRKREEEVGGGCRRRGGGGVGEQIDSYSQQSILGNDNMALSGPYPMFLLAFAGM